MTNDKAISAQTYEKKKTFQRFSNQDYGCLQALVFAKRKKSQKNLQRLFCLKNNDS